MNINNFNSVPVTMGGGFLAGILIGYALKKVLKILSVVIGLFLAGLALFIPKG
jgi:uncharacterized membrane protein (Fun14 family)